MIYHAYRGAYFCVAIPCKGGRVAGFITLWQEKLIPAGRNIAVRKEKGAKKIAGEDVRRRKIDQSPQKLYAPAEEMMFLGEIRCCIFRMPSEQSSEMR